MQIWVVAYAYGIYDGSSPDLLGAFASEEAAWAYIQRELSGAEQMNATVWGPAELREKGKA
jgi:hypothetical protein